MQNPAMTPRDVPVIYIGTKRPKIDKTYRTKLRFMPGQTHLINSTIADMFLRHKDVYTTVGTPELDAFIDAHPLDAAAYGLMTLSDEDKARLEHANAQADEAPSDEGDIIVAPKGGKVDLDEDELIEDVKRELSALAKKDMIAQWCKDNELTDVNLSGNREEHEAQALAAYTAQVIHADPD